MDIISLGIASNAAISASDCIFITNITPKTTGKNVFKIMNEYPNDASVKSFISDDNSFRVQCDWDRNFKSYCGYPTICGVPVTGITNIAGCTFTGYADISMSDISDNKVIAAFGNNTYSVDISFEAPPVIQNVTFGSLPSNQTSVKENDTIQITITADKPFSQVIIDDFELAKSKTQTVTEGTTATINITCANRSLSTATNQRVRVKIVSSTGSTSVSYISSTGILMNNSIPNLVVGTKIYPTGQQALKNTESCTVNFTTTNTDSITISSPNGDLSIGTQNSISVVVNRLSGSYNTTTNNLMFTLKFNENQATNTVSTIVNIVNIAPTLTSTTAVQIRSGLGNVSVPCTFSQDVKITGVTIPKGTLGSLTTTSTYSSSYAGLISASDTDAHSLSNVNMTILIIGMSGLTASVSKPYYIKGFATKTLTCTYPSYSVALGTTVVDPLSVICSGVLNVTPPVAVATTYDSTNILDDIRKFGITGGNTITLSNLLTSFYYGSGVTVTLTIQES